MYYVVIRTLIILIKLMNFKHLNVIFVLSAKRRELDYNSQHSPKELQKFSKQSGNIIDGNQILNLYSPCLYFGLDDFDETARGRSRVARSPEISIELHKCSVDLLKVYDTY